MKIALVLMAAMGLVRCDSIDASLPMTGELSPVEAIAAASSAAPASVSGTFYLQVNSSGKKYPLTYLNSETEYWDENNLSVDLPTEISEAFQARYGQWPEDYLSGKQIRVIGKARQVKVHFYRNGKRMPQAYYFQTHVEIDSVDDIHIVG